MLLALPGAVWSQSLPGGGSGPGGPLSTELWEVAAATGSQYSHFELENFEAPNPALEESPYDPLSMPTTVIRAFTGSGPRETLAGEVIFDQLFWTALADLLPAVDHLSGTDPEQITDAQIQEVEVPALHFQQLTASLFTRQQLDIGMGLVAALEQNQFVRRVPPNGGNQATACESDFNHFNAAWNTTFGLHFPTFLAIAFSKLTCSAEEPTGTTKLLCAAEMTFWSSSFGLTILARPPAGFAKSDLDDLVTKANEDLLGSTMGATQNNKVAIARAAKEAEEQAHFVQPPLRIAILQQGGITASSLGDLKGIATTGALAVATGTTSYFWNPYWDCQRNVTAPRFEVNAVRGRVFVSTPANPWTPVKHENGRFTITPLSRQKAKEQVWVFDADTIWANNPSWIPTFNETTQSQPFTAYVCQGVVLPNDAQWLQRPLQRANTPFLLDDLPGSSSGCISHWYLGLGTTETDLYGGPRGQRAHRACEIGPLKDNDNDGVPETFLTPACALLPTTPIPPVEVEEDDTMFVTHPVIQGVTDWVFPTDMRCLGIALPLVSSTGLTNKTVQQEWVHNVGSCWTNPSDGTVEDGHTHDSTQWRFLIQDKSWGAPRPRHCYAWDAATTKWVCNVNDRTCPCQGVNPNRPARGR